MTDKIKAPPPLPKDVTLDYIVKEGVSKREENDAFRWYIGWRYVDIRNIWPDVTHGQYANQIGLQPKLVLNSWRVAQRFTPEQVNMFPGVPFSMWDSASRVLTDDEEVLEFIEKAYDTPGLTVSEFDALLNPERTPGTKPQPLVLLGKLRAPRILPNGNYVVEVELTDLEEWEDKFGGDNPFVGKDVRVTVVLP